MKNFNWNDFKKGDIAVATHTEEIAKDFLKNAHNEGIKWTSGKCLLEKTHFKYYKEKTTYFFYLGGFGFSDRSFCSTTLTVWEVE